MTSETYRNNPMFLRNQFKPDGIFEMPLIRRQPVDLSNVKLIGYDHVTPQDGKETQSYVHFFLDDYKFEVLWNDPEPRLEKLSRYKGVLAPQFSTYYTMPVAQQLFNTFRSRWCGAYLQSKGLTVIPTVSWGLPQSYWYCFDGIEKGSVVAVSTLGVKKEKDFFLQGYQEMLRRVEPEAVICYCSPFPEMDGTVISVDYAQTNNLISDAKDYATVYIKKTVGFIISAGFGGGGGGNPKFPGFPGWDPTVPPGKEYEWRGRGTPSSGRGNWYNPKTGEWLHADLNHAEPYGPHWDYKYPNGGKGYRIYPDGTMVPKLYEGEILYA